MHAQEVTCVFHSDLVLMAIIFFRYDVSIHYKIKSKYDHSPSTKDFCSANTHIPQNMCKGVCLIHVL